MDRTCAACGRKILGEAYRETGSIYCWECYCRIQQDKQIHEASYQPEPVFYGADGRFFTVTALLTGNLNGEDACRIMCRVNQGRELVYCRRSDFGNGFELVSYPMTLVFHDPYIDWKATIQEAERLGYRVRRVWVRSKILRQK